MGNSAIISTAWKEVGALGRTALIEPFQSLALQTVSPTYRFAPNGYGFRCKAPAVWACRRSREFGGICSSTASRRQVRARFPSKTREFKRFSGRLRPLKPAETEQSLGRRACPPHKPPAPKVAARRGLQLAGISQQNQRPCAPRPAKGRPSRINGLAGMCPTKGETDGSAG